MSGGLSETDRLADVGSPVVRVGGLLVAEPFGGDRRTDGDGGWIELSLFDDLLERLDDTVHHPAVEAV